MDRKARNFIPALALALLLCGCGREDVSAPAVTLSPAEETALPPKPASGVDIEPEEENAPPLSGQTGVSVVEGIGVQSDTLSEGERVTITEETGAFFLLTREGCVYYADRDSIILTGDSLPAEGHAAFDGVPLYSSVLKKDQQLVVSQVGTSYCTVLSNGTGGTVPRWAIRMADDPEYKSWSGTSLPEAYIYTTWQMTDTPKKLPRARKVTVLLETFDGLYVDVWGTRGFMFASDIIPDPDTAAGEQQVIYPEWTDPKY